MSKIFMSGLNLFCALKVGGLNLIICLCSAHYNYSCPKTSRAADWDAVPSSSLERRQKWWSDFGWSAAVACSSSALKALLPASPWVNSSQVSLSNVDQQNTQFIAPCFHSELRTEAWEWKLANLLHISLYKGQKLSSSVKPLNRINGEQATCDLLLGFYKSLSSIMH